MYPIISHETMRHVILPEGTEPEAEAGLDDATCCVQLRWEVAGN